MAGHEGEGSRAELAHLRVAYIPIACAAPLLHALTGGFFKRHGLSVELHKAPSWDGVRRLLAYGKVDAAHILAPLALATALGLDGRPAPIRVTALLNQHGSALITSAKRPAIDGPRSLEGLTIAVPHRFSMHYYLLCEWLARGGLNPLRDTRIIELPPPRMPRWLTHGKIDAAMVPEPYAQVLVDRGDGVYAFSGAKVWQGHPCCAFALSPACWQGRADVAHAALVALVEAQADLVRRGSAEKRAAVQSFAPFLPLGATDPCAQVLAGDPVKAGLSAGFERILFAPTPYREFGVWMLAQMQRWGQLPGPIDHQRITSEIFDAAPAAELAAHHRVFPDSPNLKDLAPFAFDDPFASIQQSPFCAYREAKPQQCPDLPEPLRLRLIRLLERLADVAGGQEQSVGEIKYDDELGELERALDEALKARAFAEEAVLEQIEQQDRADKQSAVIAAQQALIREIGGPDCPSIARFVVGALGWTY